MADAPYQAPPTDLVARIEIYETDNTAETGEARLQLYLREGMEGFEFANVLRGLAQGFETGAINRIDNQEEEADGET